MAGSAPVTKAELGTWRLLGWSLLAAIVFGLLGVGFAGENLLRASRNKLAPLPPSGHYVFIGIDEKSVSELGRWPWPRHVEAQILDRAHQAGAHRVAFDLLFPDHDQPAEDAAFAAALDRNPGTIIAVQTGSSQAKLVHADNLKPIDLLAQRARLADITVDFDFSGQVWSLARGRRHDGAIRPSLAAALAESPPATTDFRLNYAFSPLAFPRYSATDLVNGRVPPAELRGRTLVVGLSSERLGDQYIYSGYGRLPGTFVQLVGAETILHGASTDLGWMPSLVVGLLFAALAARRRRRRQQVAWFGAGTAILLLVPFPLESRNIFVDVTPGLFLLAVVAIVVARRHALRRSLVNPLTGLANINALKSAAHERGRPLVAARIYNYTEIASTLPRDGERKLVEQIVQRLAVGADTPSIYHSDDGIFAWSVDHATALGHHVEALHSLFRNPVRVDGASFDVAISFGIEMGSGRSVSNRLGSALVAADEASAEGLKWKYHDPERLRDASWKLSLLSQLDAAIDNGEVWVAYQPQLDLRTGLIRGAEALARWTHPDKGPISPSEFIATAEAHDRIEKLSFFVLDQAIAAAAAINQHSDTPFDIAVNLSARLLGHRQLYSEVKHALKRHGLPAERLTLELTETAALGESGEEIQQLTRLRDLGLTLSLDDYGTGLSTLEYLRKVPASEIKIDQSFIRGMRDQRSDMVMVQSTIALAHSLGRTVVAEGVESREVLELLKSMDCDVVQGFCIGRPTSIDQLTKSLLIRGAHRAA